MRVVSSFFAILPAIFLVTSLQGKDLSYYLPWHINYDASVPKPSEVIGHEVGEWHVTHDKLVAYMYAVAEASERVRVTEYARSHEDRPLLLLTITAAQNQRNIETLRKEHLKLSDPDRASEADISNMPAVAWLGYSIHGNESSGSNAAMLVAYYLAAGQSEAIDSLLNETIILLDPCFNPDGLHRFSSWVNMHKSRNLVADPNSRELNERWPSSRTNHYWFDLNRDWMPLVHPESRGRIRQFHRWKPNVLTDHHEMGTNATYFFQPGVPSRTYPLTPPGNYVLTEKIAAYHARALDEIGSLYYTKETFDDFYYGKGSSYPDVHGCIGILFEQASSRGHLQESRYGTISFPFTIRNHFTTSLSTLHATRDLREELLDHQRRFYRDAQTLAADHPRKAYVFGTPHDPARLHHLMEMLLYHEIEIYELAQPVRAGGHTFHPGHSYLVPLDQPAHRFIRSMFEQRTDFEDSLFYDVSTWTMPLAFNIPFGALTGNAYNAQLQGEKVSSSELAAGQVSGKASPYAYVFEWDHYYAPRALYRLLDADIRVQVAARPFRTQALPEKEFGYGTVLIPAGIQEDITQVGLRDLMQEVARECGLDIHALSTGLTPKGIDLGSPSFKSVEKPEVLAVVGEGVSAYEAGEVWHLLDTRYEMPPVLVDQLVFNKMQLHDYNTIVMVHGHYAQLNDKAISRLKQWVEDGGLLILTKDATHWANNNQLVSLTFSKDTLDTGTDVQRAYAALRRERGSEHIGGVILNTRLDHTHPLGYGYQQNNLPVFRNHKRVIAPADNSFANPLVYDDKPLLAGYLADKHVDRLAGSAAVTVQARGQGRVVVFMDNPNFRGFWYGTQKLFANAMFFGRLISKTSATSCDE